MRLTCPECHARYEVADALIPPAGRELECSACNHVWMFVPLAGGAGETGAPDPAAPDPDTSVPGDRAAPVPGDRAAPVPGDRAAPVPGDRAAVAPDGAEAARQRERLDPSVLDVLREEAERETSARRAERGAEPDAGASAATSDGDAPAAAPAGASAATPPAPEADAAAPSARRTGPARDTIGAQKSGGRPAFSRAEPARDTPAPRRGFGMGMAVVLVPAVLAAALYVAAPRVAEAWPAATPHLAGYVGAVENGWRWLAQAAESTAAALVATVNNSGR